MLICKKPITSERRVAIRDKNYSTYQLPYDYTIYTHMIYTELTVLTILFFNVYMYSNIFINEP